MSPRINEEVSVLPDAAIEPITDYEMLMAKIEHDSHEDYKGVENAAPNDLNEEENRKVRLNKDKDEV